MAKMSQWSQRRVCWMLSPRCTGLKRLIRTPSERMNMMVAKTSKTRRSCKERKKKPSQGPAGAGGRTMPVRPAARSSAELICSKRTGLHTRKLTRRSPNYTLTHATIRGKPHEGTFSRVKPEIPYISRCADVAPSFPNILSQYHIRNMSNTTRDSGQW